MCQCHCIPWGLHSRCMSGIIWIPAPGYPLVLVFYQIIFIKSKIKKMCCLNIFGSLLSTLWPPSQTVNSISIVTIFCVLPSLLWAGEQGPYPAGAVLFLLIFLIGSWMVYKLHIYIYIYIYILFSCPNRIGTDHHLPII